MSTAHGLFSCAPPFLFLFLFLFLLFPSFGSAVKTKPSTSNDNAHLTTSGVIDTFLINICVFVVLMVIFEYNRFYKQIYLKRMQNKFKSADRVPPTPPEHFMGWFYEIAQVSETEVLRMVGLDAYMCLRFIVICFKLALFVTFWGMLVLLPVYSTATEDGEWDRYAISNLLEGDRGMRPRLWVSAFFGYIFAAYFCQLLYLEYNNFSVRRLQYLVQADLDGENLDPDTPPQTYFTVMLENIPSNLRSAQALHKFFDKIFPGEVYTVEIALDIAELDAMNAKRKRLRAKLERAVAHWEAKNERPLVYARCQQYLYHDDSEGIFGEDSIYDFLAKQLSWEKMGYELVDAIHYYTEKLQRYNREVCELQKKFNESAANADEDMLKKIQEGNDTRVAVFFQNLGGMALEMAGVSSEPPPLGVSGKYDRHDGEKRQGFKIERLFFGGGGTRVTLDAAFDRETQRLEQIVAHEAHEAQEVKRRMSDAKKSEEQASRLRTLSSHGAVFNTNPAAALPAPVPAPSQAMQARPFKGTTHPGVSEEEKEEGEGKTVAAEGGLDSSVHSLATNSTVSAAPPVPIRTNILEQDATLREWMHNSNVDFHREEIALSTKRTPSRAPSMSSYYHPSPSNSQHGYDNSLPANNRPFSSFYDRSTRGGSILGHPTVAGSREPSSHGHARSGPLSSLAAQLFSSHDAHSDDPHITGSAGPVSSPLHSSEGSAVPPPSSSSPPLRIVQGLHGLNSPAHSLHGGSMHGQSLHGSLHGPSVHGSMHGSQNGSFSYDHSALQPQNPLDLHHRTETGGISTVLPVQALTNEQLNELTLLSIEKAKLATRQGWLQTKIAGSGALRGIVEIERAIEMVMLGAYYKYSSTAFVTFQSRVTESIAQQMLLSHDSMEINHAPNPHEIIWDNVAIPKSQNIMRHYITNAGIVVGSIFWSSLVNDVNSFASFFPLASSQQQLVSAALMLVFLLILPFIFDYLARNYEGMKLESEIQNSIMTRYFYYQLINVYVTVGFSSSNLWVQILDVLRKPQTLVDIIGGRMPEVSKYFFNLLIVKTFTAVPLEMIRPWQLSTIHLMGNCMNRRQCTRRDLRTGAFFSWPMLYGWIYPQLMMVLMIMLTYSVITPVLSPLCALFFSFAYIMYKYQLLYVYINEYQSGGYMWYAVFNHAVIALIFSSCTLLGYLSLQLTNRELSGPFFFMLPLPFCLFYFGKYTEAKFKKPSMNLSYGFARELDHRNAERKTAGKQTPHDTFTKTCYRQPSLTETDVLPEPYRNDGNYDILHARDTGEKVVMADWNRANRKGSLSLNVHELVDEGEEDPIVLQDYFESVIIPLSKLPDPADVESQHTKEDTPLVTRERR